MTVTVQKLSDGHWWYEQDLPRGPHVGIMHLIDVPKEAEFIEFLDASRPHLALHALRVKMLSLESSVIDLDFNAHSLVTYAEMKCHGFRIVTSIF